MDKKNNIIDELIDCLKQETEICFNKIKENKNKNRFLKLMKINFNKKSTTVELNLFINEVIQELDYYGKTMEDKNIDRSTIIIEKLKELVENEKKNNN